MERVPREELDDKLSRETREQEETGEGLYAAKWKGLRRGEPLNQRGNAASVHNCTPAPGLVEEPGQSSNFQNIPMEEEHLLPLFY